jgi:hypothetical protein
MRTFTDLAALALVATGADRELDVLIGETIDLMAYAEYADSGIRQSLKLNGLERVVELADTEQCIWSSRLPRYSSSMDAVLTLNPANTQRRIEFGTHDDGTGWAYVHLNGPVGEAVGEAETAANEVLAVLTAMLNARAILVGEPIWDEEGAPAVRLEAASPPPGVHIPECD